MNKLIFASILGIVSLSSIANAKTLNMAPVTVKANVETIEMAPVTVVGHAKRHTLTFAPLFVKVKVQATHVERAFASASYSVPSACEAFTRWDGTTVTICGGSVKSITDGSITRMVNN